jgi:tetratricopeptide (TPR) repeat protein
MKKINIAALMMVVSLLISLLSGLNQFTGFFANISLPTAILSVIIAITVALVFPVLLRKKWPRGKTIMKMSYRAFSVVLAVVIIIVGVGPFIGKYVSAVQARTQGNEYLDKNLYSQARVELNHAADYFEDLGFSSQAINCKIVLIQAYAGIGNFDRAKELIEEVEKYANLSIQQQGKLNGVRGNIAYNLGEFEQAERFYQMALNEVETDSQAEASVLQNQAVLWSGKGAQYHARVLDNIQRARVIYETLNDETGLLDLLINEGVLYGNDLEQSRSFYEQALSLAENLKDSYHLGVIYQNLGVIYRQQGDLDSAEDLYQQAIQEFQKVADLAGQAEVMANLAALEIARGRNEAARQYLQSSEADFKNIDQSGELVNFRKIAQIRTVQGDIYDSFGESETARKYYEEALSLYSQHPDPLQEAETIVNYAALLVRLNLGEEARNQLESAREIIEVFAGEGPNETLGVVYSNLGKTYQDIGDYPKALAYYEKSRDIFSALEDTLHYAQAVENRGIILGMQGNLDDGISDIKEALKIYQELNNHDLEAKATFNLYCLYSSTGEADTSNLINNLLDLLENFKIDQETEAGILFGIAIKDIGNSSELIVYRERLLQMKAFYEKRDEPIGLGRSLIQLAGAEQKLGNYDDMVKYARAAEEYVDQIPLPLRIGCHEDLGWYITGDNPEDGIDHFFKAFDLSQGVYIKLQIELAQTIAVNLYIYNSYIDHEKYRIKAQQILKTTNDAQIREIFQAIVDTL